MGQTATCIFYFPFYSQFITALYNISENRGIYEVIFFGVVNDIFFEMIDLECTQRVSASSDSFK